MQCRHLLLELPRFTGASSTGAAGSSATGTGAAGTGVAGTGAASQGENFVLVGLGFFPLLRHIKLRQRLVRDTPAITTCCRLENTVLKMRSQTRTMLDVFEGRREEKLQK